MEKDLIKCDICVVGGGASGLMAALAAADSGADVCLAEGCDRVGRKILKTGNGKCNLSHEDIRSGAYHGSGAERIESYLDRFGVRDTVGFFTELGLPLRTRDGYIYPFSEQASAVLDVLRFALRVRGIKLVTERHIDSVVPVKDGFVIGQEIFARRVILCTGGCASPDTGSDGSGIDIARKLGLRIVDPMPALVKIITDEKTSQISGVRAKGTVTCDDLNEFGEIQFTADGISGIPVFDLSGRIIRRLVDHKPVRVYINLITGLSPEPLLATMHDRLESMHDIPMTVEEFLTGMIHKKLTVYILNRLGIRPGSDISSLSDDDLKDYLKLASELDFDVIDHYGYDHAQVSSGGVHFDEVDSNLESIGHPGLYLAGELLDIDGICGGYNLQWAWTSGHIAGSAAAASLA